MERGSGANAGCPKIVIDKLRVISGKKYSEIL